MIILSLAEKNLLAIEKELEKKSKADLVEIRLDALNIISIPTIDKLLKTYPLLIALRSKQEGGIKAYTLSQRHQILKEIINLKPKFLDLEYARDQKLISYIKKKSPQTKIILSFHSTTKVLKNIEFKLIQMKKLSCWKYKIASQSRSILDALKMLILVKKHANFIGISMGEKGVCTRLLGPIFNQPITYASLEDKKTAPGQLSIHELTEFYRYPAYNKKTKILGLIGNPVWQSPGLRVYNTLFFQESTNAIYLNFELKESELKNFFKKAKKLNFWGLSVTIPFKEKVVSFLDQTDESQVEIKSINTLLFKKQKLYGINTDGLGALNMIQQIVKVKNKRVLIIGAGGTSYGIGFILKKAEAQITIVNRTYLKAKALAKKLKVECKPFDELKKNDYDILIHTTSVGTGNKVDCLVDKKSIFEHKIVLDVAFNDTKLLKLAREKNCITYSGKEFWRWQAELQYQFWFKVQDRLIKEKLEKIML